MLQHDERRGLSTQWLLSAVLAHFPNRLDHTNVACTRTSIHTDIQYERKRMDAELMCACMKTSAPTFKGGYPEPWRVQYCEWQDWFLCTELIYIFLLFSHSISTVILPPFTKLSVLIVCACAHARTHTPKWMCVSQSVITGERGRSLSFSRNTPRTNVPHLCTARLSLSSITGAPH